jgi:hypothetical protein
MPPKSGTEPPDKPELAPRKVTGMRSRLARRMIARSSAAMAGVTGWQGVLGNIVLTGYRVELKTLGR